MRKLVVSVCVSVCLAAVTATSASGADEVVAMKVKPGKWETTVVTTVSLMPQPRTSTATECFTEETLDPGTFLSQQAEGCEISNIRSTTSAMKFDLSCSMPQGTAKGSGAYRTTGDTMTGEFDMTMEGMVSVTVSNKISGKWLGKCD